MNAKPLVQLRDFCFTVIITAFFGVVSAATQTASITHAYVDGSGAVHVVTAAAKDTVVAKETTQIGAAEIKIADDHRTVGWLVEYPNPDPDRAWEKLYGTLVLWRDGRVLRRFSTEQVFRSWGFWQGSKQVAFHTGPLHGSGRSELHDLAAGRLSAAYNDDDTGPAPDWAQSLDPK